jgi:hypothetical protein
MVRAPRKKFIIAVAVSTAAALAIFAVHRASDAVRFAFLSATEKKVVGEWKIYSIGGEIVTTIRPDHTWTSIGGCLEPAEPINGRWRVDGSDIVYTIDQPYLEFQKIEPWRQPIQQLIDDDRQVRSWALRPAKK